MSSKGYIVKLFGGLVVWQANKQDTVTTSTTEAELLALSQVAKEAIFTSRLVKDLRITLSYYIVTIRCDNQQTIRLVTEEVDKLQTKLHHVDIHNHWLRQEIIRGTIRVTYQLSEDMVADGLTKRYCHSSPRQGLGNLLDILSPPRPHSIQPTAPMETPNEPGLCCRGEYTWL